MQILLAYTKKYDDLNYGLSFADGHIVRFYERILKYKLDFKAGNMLDFGCGNGVHSAYFKSKGYKCFGVDSAKLKEKLMKNLLGGGGGGGVRLSSLMPVLRDFLRKR